MINNLLDMARLEQGRAAPRIARAAGVLLQAAAEVIRPRAEDRGVELSLDAADDLPPVSVDPDQFQHALQNLLDNALAHAAGRADHPGGGRRRGGRGLQRDRYRQRHPRRVSALGLPALFPRARHARRRQRPGTGHRPRNRHRPRRFGAM